MILDGLFLFMLRDLKAGLKQAKNGHGCLLSKVIRSIWPHIRQINRKIY